MQRLLRDRASLFVAICCFLRVLAAKPSYAADVFVGVPSLNPDIGEQFSIDISVDVGAAVLGSYFFELHYDSSVVRIVSVGPGTTLGFNASPTTDPTSFDSGVTPIAEAQGGTGAPMGFVNVASISFEAVGDRGQGSSLSVDVISLFSGEGRPLPANSFPSSVLIGFDPTLDPDSDGLTNQQELIAGTEFENPDTDGDGLSDGTEVLGGLDPLDDGSTDPNQGSAGDPDSDGLTNLTEQAEGCSPTVADTDSDGVVDSAEVIAGTDCADQDTDDDGLSDGFEETGGLDPLDDGSIDANNGGNGDPDGDELTNLEEQTAGTDPSDSDSDDDGLPDDWEVSHDIDPRDDGQTDRRNGPAGDPDADGRTNAEEFAAGTDPQEEDSDGDGLEDGAEAAAGTDPLDPDSDDDGLPDGCDPGPLDDGSLSPENGPLGDPDGDTVLNSDECTRGTKASSADSDQDGLTDDDEISRGTDPLAADTDGDAMSDGFEVAHALDPQDGGTVDPAIGPLGDLDADSFSNSAEAAVASDPRDFRSRPVSTNLVLRGGFAPVFYPLVPASGLDAEGLVAAGNLTGFATTIAKVETPNLSISTATISGTDFAPEVSDNFSITPSEGVFIDVFSETAWSFAGPAQCEAIDLMKGANVIGVRCAPPGYSAFQMLHDIGSETEVAAVQKFNPDTGRFETASYASGTAAGSDFLIRAGEAYLVHMLVDRPGFDPIE